MIENRQKIFNRLTIDSQHIDNRQKETLEIVHGFQLLHHSFWNKVLSQVYSAADSPNYSPVYGRVHGRVYGRVYDPVYGRVY